MVKKYPKLAVKNIFPSKYEIQGPVSVATTLQKEA